jgi:hypothetical protein
MRIFVAIFSLVLFNSSVPRHKTCPAPSVKVDLAQKYQFRPFGIPKHGRTFLAAFWKSQQGIVFVSPGIVAIYQVQENDQLPPVQSRDISGGAGKYIFKIVFLDADDGSEIRSLTLTTNSGFSHVYATHDGYFLVRTGEILRLYSPAFEAAASMPLPLLQDERNQGWTDFVSSSGREIGLKYSADNGSSTPYISRRYLLDADTLKMIATLGPENETDWPENLSTAARSQFPKNLLSANERVTPVLSNGSLLVGQIWHELADPLDLLTYLSKPRRIEVFDLTENVERCYIPVTAKRTSTLWPAVFWDLSKDGKIAVIQQQELSIYKP